MQRKQVKSVMPKPRSRRKAEDEDLEQEDTKAPVSNRASISVSNPQPFEGGRAFSYVNDSQYLPFLAPDDTYGQLLLESRLLSDTHNACITTKKDYCAGNGFQLKDDSELPKKVKLWLSSMNKKDEPVAKINKQIFENYFTFGNVPIELVRFTVGRKRHLFVYAHNFLEWRLAVPDDDDICTEAIQSKLFLRKDFFLPPELYDKAKKLPIYNPRNSDKQNWKKDGNGAERTLIWYRHVVSGFNYYGLPSAVASLIYQGLEYKSARYNMDNFDNNMVISAILALKGNLSQKEADRIGKKAVSTHTGDGKRGRLMVVASEEGIDGSSMHSMDTHKDGSFAVSDEVWMQKIILANQWDAVLAGILSPKTLGKGSGFLSKILEIKQNTVIRPAQTDLMNEVWRSIFNIANDWLGFTVKAEDLEIDNAIDISGLTDVDITPVVTVNEVREAKNLPRDKTSKGKMYLGELASTQKQYTPTNANPTPNNPDPNKT